MLMLMLMLMPPDFERASPTADLGGQNRCGASAGWTVSVLCELPALDLSGRSICGAVHADSADTAAGRTRLRPITMGCPQAKRQTGR